MSRDVTRIAIAAATRQRPRMLADLLQSFQALDVPQGAELCFVIVENDAEFSIESLVAEFSKRSGWPAYAIHEPQRGISPARNAALRAADGLGADWLAFVDDDEQVRHDWLRLLFAGAKDAGAGLVGGPVVPVAPKTGCSDAQLDVLDYFTRAGAIESARKAAATRGTQRIDIGTGNWLAELSQLSVHSLEFNPAYGLSGGEDTDFSRRAFAAGIKLAWVENAIVTEEVLAERLNARYIADRARAQSLRKFEILKTSRPRRAVLGAIFETLTKSGAGVLSIAISPISGSYSYFRGVRWLGIASGYWAGLRGQKGLLRYSEVIGE